MAIFTGLIKDMLAAAQSGTRAFKEENRLYGIGTSRDEAEGLVGQAGRELSAYTGGETSVKKFVEEKSFRNQYFVDLARRYNEKDKTGDPVARALNQFYQAGDMEAIHRVADVIAERLRPGLEQGKAKSRLLDITKSKPVQLGQPGGTATTDKVGAAVTTYFKNRRRGVNYGTSVKAGETGGVSGRRSGGPLLDTVESKPEDVLGTKKVLLGT